MGRAKKSERRISTLQGLFSSSWSTMSSVKTSRRYIVTCFVLLMCIQCGLSCTNSVFINAFSIISECRTQMHDILLLMCRIPSFGNIFGGRKYHVTIVKSFLKVKILKRHNYFQHNWAKKDPKCIKILFLNNLWCRCSP